MVWLGARRQGRRITWRQAPNGDSVAIFAAGVLAAALGVCFYPYLAILAVVPFRLAALREISARRG